MLTLGFRARKGTGLLERLQNPCKGKVVVSIGFKPYMSILERNLHIDCRSDVLSSRCLHSSSALEPMPKVHRPWLLSPGFLPRPSDSRISTVKKGPPVRCSPLSTLKDNGLVRERASEVENENRYPHLGVLRVNNL